MSQSKVIIYFRADGNLHTGYGHVIRSLALLSLLKNKFECRFLIHRPDEFLVKEINKTGAAFIDLPAFSVLEEEANYITENICQKNDFVVLDGYKFTSTYQSLIRQGCGKLICIDDIYQTHFYADVIINHSEGVSKKWYQHEWYTHLFLGARYALLRKPFHKTGNGYTLSKKEGHRVFINLGGTDPQNYTLKALRLVLKIKNVAQADIVVGALFPFKEELNAVISQNEEVDIRLHINVDAAGMAKLMRQSSIGVCAASSVSYEYASVGGVLFLYQTVSNQKNIYASFIKSTIAYPATKLLKMLPVIQKQVWQRKYFQHRELFFAGNPAKNLNGIFEKLLLESRIEGRLAGEADWKQTFDFGKKQTGGNCLYLIPDTKETYQEWYKKRLTTSQAPTYIFREENKIIGLVYIEQTSNKIANVIIRYDEKQAAKGYAEIILRKAIFMFRLESVSASIQGIVRDENSFLQTIFLTNGFVQKGVLSKAGHKYIKYSLSFRS